MSIVAQGYISLYQRKCQFPRLYIVMTAFFAPISDFFKKYTRNRPSDLKRYRSDSG